MGHPPRCHTLIGRSHHHVKILYIESGGHDTFFLLVPKIQPIHAGTFVMLILGKVHIGTKSDCFVRNFNKSAESFEYLDATIYRTYPSNRFLRTKNSGDYESTN